MKHIVYSTHRKCCLTDLSVNVLALYEETVWT